MADAAVVEKTKKPKLSKKQLKIILVALLIALGGFLVSIYLSVAYNYRTHYYPRTVINQIDAGGMTPDEVEKIIAERAKEYAITVKFRDDKRETIKASQIDYHFVSDGGAQKALDDQHWLLWPLGYLRTDATTVSTDTTFDEKKLTDALAALPEYQDENMEAPKDAFVEYRENAFQVVPETYGTKFDKATVTKAVIEAVKKSETTFDVESIPDVYAAPSILSDNADLKQEAEELNGLTKASITWQLPTGEQTLDGNTTREWLKKDEDGHYYKDEESWNEHIANYVEETAIKIKTVGTDRSFKATGIDEPITVGGGDYGWRMDYYAELDQLTEELNNGTVTKREPVYLSRELTSENNGFGNTYIEVDVSRQHLWAYKDGKVVLESDCVTGRMTRERYTPSGIFTLAFKARDRNLRGQIDPTTGEPEYISFVHYWMPFNGGVGFHDASWRYSFGGQIYIYSGSHGCVNLPTKFAPQLYDFITKDMPIIVYYSEGCQFED